jgi:hypothetical protein
MHDIRCDGHRVFKAVHIRFPLFLKFTDLLRLQPGRLLYSSRSLVLVTP